MDKTIVILVKFDSSYKIILNIMSDAIMLNKPSFSLWPIRNMDSSCDLGSARIEWNALQML